MGDQAKQTKYHHLANLLRERIATQPSGYKLPSVRALMKRFHVCQHTVTSAFSLLEEDGLIERRHGSGVYSIQADRPTTICFCRPQDANYQEDLRERALRNACVSRGWQLVTNRFDAIHPDLFADEIRADAFVFTGDLISYRPPILQRLIDNGVPIVVIGRDTRSVSLDFVMGDNARLIHQFVRGLVERGHRRIAYLDCEPPFYEVKKRVEYFLEICSELKLEHYPVFSANAVYGTSSVVKSYKFLRQYLEGLNSKPLPFTAMITGSTSGSIPAILAFHELGYKVPEDLSLCCIGSDPRARYSVPPLSNASLYGDEIADAVMKIIDRRLSGDTSKHLHQFVKYDPIWRESVGPVPQ